MKVWQSRDHIFVLDLISRVHLPREILHMPTSRVHAAFRIINSVNDPCKTAVLPSPFHTLTLHIYDSVVTLALAFVTLTPSDFAFAMISTRFLAETACA